MARSLREWESISEALRGASEFDLQVEVVWFALKAVKENPQLTIEEAINIGFDEWIK